MLLLCSSLRAQETGGRLHGNITDSAGNPLVGATIILLHQPTGTRYTTQSLKGGIYSFSGLRIGGPYQLSSSFIGMKGVDVENIQVNLGEPARLAIIMQEQTNQLAAVSVVSGGRRNRPGKYGTGLNIASGQMQSMPAISRSFQDITRLVPQASKDNSFLGTNFRYNNVTIDGAINNDAIGFSPSVGGQTGTSGQPGSSTRTNPVSLDAIEDMQVELAPYDVKIGNFTGGSVNAVTKSGTNTVKGSLYAYGRNATITGKESAGNKRKMPSDFHDYQTGFSIGMPLIKNKLFLFTNEEITRKVDVVTQEAGSASSDPILSLKDAQNIHDTVLAMPVLTGLITGIPILIKSLTGLIGILLITTSWYCGIIQLLRKRLPWSGISRISVLAVLAISRPITRLPLCWN
jgi:hypothetical protein